MALSDIPSKIIEKAGTLSEKKMEIAFNLTQLIHKEGKEEKKVLATFTHCLDLIKEFLPQDQATHLMPPQSGKKSIFYRSRLLLIALGAFCSATLILYIILHLVGIGTLLKLFGLNITNIPPTS